MQNKKGQVGLETVKSVMLTLLIVGVIAFLLIIVLFSARDSSVAKSSSGTILVINETLTTVNEAGEYYTVSDLPDVVCDLLYINGNGSVIPTTNYTTDNCHIAVSAIDCCGQYNNTNWNVTYNYHYNLFANAQKNVSSGVTDLFSNVSTWFALLGVAVIILIVAIVLFAVNRFGGGRAGL